MSSILSIEYQSGSSDSHTIATILPVNDKLFTLLVTPLGRYISLFSSQSGYLCRSSFFCKVPTSLGFNFSSYYALISPLIFYLTHSGFTCSTLSLTLTAGICATLSFGISISRFPMPVRNGLSTGTLRARSVAGLKKRELILLHSSFVMSPTISRIECVTQQCSEPGFKFYITYPPQALIMCMSYSRSFALTSQSIQKVQV